MTFTEAQDKFAIRLYDWSFRDLLKELEEGCPLLSCVGLHNRRVAALVAWNETLTIAQRFPLARALTRRSHENAMRIKHETLTEEDEAWLETYHGRTTQYMSSLPPLGSADKTRPEFVPPEADRCLDLLVTVLDPRMGKVSRRKSKVICTRLAGEWRFVTEFVFSRREESLSFEYQFIRKDGSPVRTGHPGQGPFPRTLLMFYGIYTSTAYVPSDSDTEPVARAMSRLAEHFISHAEPLFNGLGLKD